MIVKVVVGFFVVLLISLVVMSVVIMVNPNFSAKVEEEDDSLLSTPKDSKKKGKSKKSDKTNKSVSSSKEPLGDTKEFYPVKKYYDNAISLGQHNYRAIIECSSINYNLMSPLEQSMVDGAYQRFLNTLSFAVEIYIQTTEFDSIQMMDYLHQNILESVSIYPSVNEYAANYEENMKNLTAYTNNKLKKKYVIVSYGSADFSDVSELSNEELTDFALNELSNRASIVASGLAGCGVGTRILNKQEIAEVLYAYYHRDYYRIARDIIGGELSSLIINSDKTYKSEQSLDHILSIAENSIKTELLRSASYEETVLYKHIVEILGDLRQHSAPMNLKELLDLSRKLAKEERYRTYGTYEVGEPSDEDYLQAFGLKGSGVTKEDIAPMVQAKVGNAVLNGEATANELEPWTEEDDAMDEIPDATDEDEDYE